VTLSTTTKVTIYQFCFNKNNKMTKLQTSKANVV